MSLLCRQQGGAALLRLQRCVVQPVQQLSNGRQSFSHQMWRTRQRRNRSTALYGLAGVFGALAASYASVPLYRLFCQATGYAGTTKESKDTDLSDMEAVTNRPITVKFNADVANSMQWKFHPQQSEIKVVPGESALAFYTAYNPTDKPIIGISTYNVLPLDAGQYFNKIQCFCFEEQRLEPHEQVDMPVFFYVDPEFAKDPLMRQIKTLTLSYTFFESKNFDMLTMGGPEGVAKLQAQTPTQTQEQGQGQGQTQAQTQAEKQAQTQAEKQAQTQAEKQVQTQTQTQGEQQAHAQIQTQVMS